MSYIDPETGLPRLTVTPNAPPTVDDPRIEGWRNQEQKFQAGIRATPWFSEFKQKYGEEPNLNDPNYDYRAAWAAGERPVVRDPGDGLLHWSSQFKGANHPNRFVNGVDTVTGQRTGPDQNFLNQYYVEVDDGSGPRQQFTLPAARAHRQTYDRPGLLGHLVRGARDVVPPTPWDPDKPRPELAQPPQSSTVDKILDYGSVPAKMVAGVFTPPAPPERPVTGKLPPTERSAIEDEEYFNRLGKFGIDTGLNMIGAGRLPGASQPGAIGAGGGSAPMGSTVRNAAPIRAYHSSPHDFDKFDFSKIGTGEGAQAYGHGLYFAENPKVSGQGGQYWNQFKSRFYYNPAETEAISVLQNHNFDRDKAIAELVDARRYDAGYIGGATNSFDRAKREAIVAKNNEALALLQSGKIVGPRTYEVNIHARPEQLVNYDAPLSSQPSAAQDILGKLNRYDIAKVGEGRWEVRHPGGWVPNAAKNFYRSEEAAVKAAEGLNVGRTVPDLLPRNAEQARPFVEAGIPGIRYFDQGSRVSVASERIDAAKLSRDLALKRGDQEGVAYWDQRLAEFAKPQTSNYVIFDPGIIEIAKKYGIPGMLGAGALGSTVAPDRYKGGT